MSGTVGGAAGAAAGTATAGPFAAGNPADFDLLGPLPLSGTVVLEASAGTGKTYAIAALVLRHVVETDVPFARMLVLTFGRAASEELRSRVRGALVEAEGVLARRLDGDDAEPDDAVLRHVLHASRDRLPDAYARVRAALADFDRATIATTHQFCQRVLASLGVAGDTEPEAELVEDVRELVEEVVDDLLVRRALDRPDREPLPRDLALGASLEAVGDPHADLCGRGADPGGRRREVLDFAADVRAEVDLRKRRLGVMTYDDLLSRLSDALADEDALARSRMREQWQLVLVDEFQDTDPVQWRVLRDAFAGAATMVLVGDPKQAIYAFRGGDVPTYLQARATATSLATLGTNHRSDRPLVDAVHTLLRSAELGDPRIAVRPVVAERAGSRLSGAPSPAPFRLRMVPRERLGPPDTLAHPYRAWSVVRADLADDVARLLRSGARFADRALLPEDVAVLVGTHSQASDVQASLRRRGVDAVIGSNGSVLTTTAAAEWLTLLEAMSQPHRTDRVRAVALTCFVGATAAELDLDEGPLTERVADQVRLWARLTEQRGVAAVLEDAAARHGLYARVLAWPEGERLLTDLRHVAELMHRERAAGRASLASLESWLREERARDEEQRGGDRPRRLDSDRDAVQVLTIHGAKGQQFPVCYLPTLCLQPFRGDGVRRLHLEGRRSLELGVPPVPRDVEETAHAELLGEELRLLYVALTRAQSQVVTWWAPHREVGSSPGHRVLMGRALDHAHVPADVRVPSDEDALDRARRWQSVGAAVVEPLEQRDPPDPPAPESPPALAVRAWTRSVDTEWRRLSYSAISSTAEAVAAAGAALGAVQATGGTVPAHSADAGPGVGSEQEAQARQDEDGLRESAERAVPETADPALRSALLAPSLMGGVPGSAALGSLVHAVLEHVDPTAPEHDGDLHAEVRSHLEEQVRSWPVRGLTADLRTQLVDALAQTVRSPLGPLLPGLSLADVAVADRLCELDFELPLGGGDRPDVLPPARVGALARVLRDHLPADDPVLRFADELERPGYADQVLRGYLTGSLDLVVRAGDRYVVADYKTNTLSPRDADAVVGHYAPSLVTEAMLHSSYPLQALLYAVALHRFLRWRVPGYDPERHLGGVAYLFVRGMVGPATPVVDGEPCGVFSWRPPAGLVAAASDVLAGEVGP